MGFFYSWNRLWWKPIIAETTYIRQWFFLYLELSLFTNEFFVFKKYLNQICHTSVHITILNGYYMFKYVLLFWYRVERYRLIIHIVKRHIRSLYYLCMISDHFPKRVQWNKNIQTILHCLYNSVDMYLNLRIH